MSINILVMACKNMFIVAFNQGYATNYVVNKEMLSVYFDNHIKAIF